MIIKILKTKTFLEYLQIRENLLGDLEEYEIIQKESPTYDQKQIEKINQIKIMLALPEDLENGKIGFEIIDSNIYY